jgi:hypothetical protein
VAILARWPVSGGQLLGPYVTPIDVHIQIACYLKPFMLSLPPRDPNLDFLSTYLEPQGFLDCNFYGRSVRRKVVGGDFPFPQTFDNHDTTIVGASSDAAESFQGAGNSFSFCLKEGPIRSFCCLDSATSSS